MTDEKNPHSDAIGFQKGTCQIFQSTKSRNLGIEYVVHLVAVAVRRSCTCSNVVGIHGNDEVHQ